MNPYPVYQSRRVHDLSGLLDFAFIPKDAVKFNAFTPASVNEYKDFQILPGCFDAAPEYAGKHGLGVYRTSFTLAKSGKCLLKLGGVTLYAKIFLDGVEIGDIRLPYSGCEFPFEAAAGRHEAVIAVSNAPDYELCKTFSAYYDFYGFGGVLRSIEIHELPQSAFGRCFVHVKDAEKGLVTLEIEADHTGSLPLEIAFDSSAPCKCTPEFTNGKAFVESFVPSPKLWTPGNGAMHTVTVASENDSITESFGLRTIEIKGNLILINGEEFIARGYNRHESHPESGSAVPACVLLEDVQILKDLNCNFVRGSHYPQSQLFLDMCDRAGMCVWEETLAWNDDADHLSDPAFLAAQTEQLRLMIRNSFNHPCVVMWGFMNETSSEKPESVNVIKTLAAESKKLDPSRPTTFASARIDNELCLDYVDIISTNTYPGWYGCDFSGEQQCEKIAPRLRDVQNIVMKTGKPWILSEIGAAAVYGCRDRMKCQWSEEYQCEYMQTVCDFINASPYKPGLALWQFTDARSYASSPHLNRARGFNNKGSLDEYRRPKAVCGVVREAFRQTGGKKA